MARADDVAFREWVEAARTVPIGDVVDRVGLRLRGGNESSGPCPAPGCGGRDRFNVNRGKGVWFCRQCDPRGGGVIDLVMFLDGCDFLAACESLTGQASPRGEGRTLPVEELARRERERVARALAEAANQDAFRKCEIKRLRRWWERARHARGTPVEDYLRLRRVTLPAGACVRFDPLARLYASGRPDAEVIHAGPAMLAGIVGRDGSFAGLHTTWIDLAAPDGKARVPDPETGEFLPAKKVRGSQKGGRIELQRHPSPRRIIMGEGIETTLSVRDDMIEAGRDLSDAAFWSGINLGNIGGPAEGTVPHPVERDRGNRPRRVSSAVPAGDGIPIPDCVEEIVLLGDGDSDPFLTAQTFDRAAARWARPDRVIRPGLAPAGHDFNSLRRARKARVST